MLTLNSLFFKEFTVEGTVRQSLHGISAVWLPAILAACIGSLLLFGCTPKATEPVDAYLIKVGNSTLTVSEFNEVFEISKTAYSHSDIMDPKIVADIKLRLLNQMIEEMILLEKADAIGISISDEEFEKEVQEIKADYPDGVFEEMLLEAAVSFEAWKKRLRAQLIARKFIKAELESKIAITSEEVARYYAQHLPEDSKGGPDGKEQGISDEMILKMLKNQKVQILYAAWMKKNRRTVTIDINSQQWEKINHKNS